MQILKRLQYDMEYKKDKKIKVNQYRYHNESCCSPENDKGKRPQSSYFKYQELSI